MVEKTEADDPSTAGPSSGGAKRCLFDGCERRDVAQCAFVDRHQRRCPTHWCPVHGTVQLGGHALPPSCRVAQLLGPAPPAGSVPELDNRSPSLVNFVARAIDAEVRALLAPLAADGESLAEEPVHIAVGTRTRRWEHAWALRTPAGHDRVRVAVEVDDHRDPELALRVGHEVIARSIPPGSATGCATRRSRRSRASPSAPPTTRRWST